MAARHEDFDAVKGLEFLDDETTQEPRPAGYRYFFMRELSVTEMTRNMRSPT